MSNIKNFNFNNIDARLSNSEFYDFYLAQDEYSDTVYNNIVSGDSLIAEFDFNNPSTYEGDAFSATSMYSLSTWDEAVNTGLTLNNIGLTGLDNGLIPYQSVTGDTANTALTQVLSGTTLEILSGETSFIVNPVTGYTGDYIYPIDMATASTVGNYAQLCGGYYQGFYKIDGNTYQTLPNRYEKGWTVEFWLNKTDDCSGYTATTLNDDYSANTGFFFYLGTRAENKFWNVFEGLNTGSTSGCTSGATSLCTIPKETNLNTTSGYPLSPPPLTFTEIDNKFLIFSRADGSGGCSCSGSGGDAGKTVCTFTGDSIIVTSTTMETTDTRNKFTIFSQADGSGGCSCSGSGGDKGTTICSYSGDSQPILELDYEADLVKSTNAFGLRIKDDGSIGYRALRFTCITATTSAVTTVSSGITVEESYSSSGVVSDDQWTHVTVKFVADVTYEGCKLRVADPRNGKLMFYVNGRLKHVVRDFEEIIPKRLTEFRQKQEAVPFNISLGGGSQGLLESMTFDGQDPDDLGLPIETNFAGTFIGGLSKFRMYNEPLSWCQIKNNYEYEFNLFGL